MNASTGGLHSTVQAYLAEALVTFRTGNNLASAAMLGAASEKVFLELCEAIAKGFSASADQSAFQTKTAPKNSMVKRVKAVTDWLSQKKSQLPIEWKSAERHRLIEKVADLIRNRRNDTGHPQDPPMTPSHEEMYALLMLFPDHCIKLYELTTPLKPKVSQPRRGTGQVWRAELCNLVTNEAVECWMLRRIGSRISAQIELVFEHRLRDRLNLSDGTPVRVTVFEG